MGPGSGFASTHRSPLAGLMLWACRREVRFGHAEQGPAVELVTRQRGQAAAGTAPTVTRCLP
jgi:hypothetical protein